jgi:DNA-directed RNA polymerase subunit M/transcription elongation factor TFIIS
MTTTMKTVRAKAVATLGKVIADEKQAIEVEELLWQKHLDKIRGGKIATTMNKFAYGNLVACFMNHMKKSDIGNNKKQFRQRLLKNPAKVVNQKPIEMVPSIWSALVKMQALEDDAQKQSKGTDMFTCGACKGSNCTYFQLNRQPISLPA